MSHWVSGDIAARYRAFRPNYPTKLFEYISRAYYSSTSSGATTALSELPTPAPPAAVLDIGCGSGQAIQGMMKMWPTAAGTKYIGLDPSAAQLSEARSVLIPPPPPPTTATTANGGGGIAAASDSNSNSNNSNTNDHHTSSLSHHLNSNSNNNSNVVLMCADAGDSVSFRREWDRLFPPQQDKQKQQQKVSLVTVAQALHWINIPQFCHHLLSPTDGVLDTAKQTEAAAATTTGGGGLLAVWYYGTTRIVNNEHCDRTLRRFDQKLLSNGFWPQERMHIENKYRDQIAQLSEGGFTLVDKQVVVDERESTLEDFVLYLSTWSGVSKYAAAVKRSDVLEVEIRKPFESFLGRSDSTDENRERRMLKLHFEFELLLFRPTKNFLPPGGVK